MESLYLLIPMSIVVTLLAGVVLVWAAMGGQFDDLEAEGVRILQDPSPDADVGAAARTELDFRQSPARAGPYDAGGEQSD
jgi:cbb3-type cytochrome oxidase maturation protein